MRSALLEGANGTRLDHDVDSIVIGAGVVGLAVGRALALRGAAPLVLDAEPWFGAGISSRNSEVIHAGIYYPAGSLKARLCVAGKHALYDYCARRGVEHHRLGKLIVAAEEAELPVLEALADKGRANGVDDLRLLSRTEALAMEPALACVGALYSPSSGVVDSHGLMTAFVGDMEAHGGALVLRTPGESVEASGDGFVVRTGGAEPGEIRCRTLVNAAGLSAPALARRVSGLDPATVPEGRLCKGSYYGLTGRAPFSRLIYPAPEQAGLGVHLTLDLAGRARFGPDVEWVDEANYDVDLRRADGFYAAIRRYWPGLPDGALTPAYAGIRPKIQAPGEPARDFMISTPDQHGLSGYVGLYGVESPGLTASMALAELVADALT